MTRFGKSEAERERISSVAKKHGMRSPSFLDFDKRWTDASDIAMNPTFVLLDKQGGVAFRSVGQLAEGDADYVAISKLVGEM